MAKRTPDEEAYIPYGDIRIPVSLYFEKRRNTRISIGGESIHLRLPYDLSKEEFREQIRWAKMWLMKRFEKAPNLLDRFQLAFFKKGDRIQVMGDVYVIHIKSAATKSSKARMEGRDIFIELQSNISDDERNKAIHTLIHKVLCKRYLPDVTKSIKQLNRDFFNERITKISLKYIHSKWGSCSTDGEIVISSKLLLCPKWIQTYVYVHELAHLVEPNHSQEFWNVVENVLPDYKKAEDWLNKEGNGVMLRPIYRNVPEKELLEFETESKDDGKDLKKTISDRPEPNSSASLKKTEKEEKPTLSSKEEKEFVKENTEIPNQGDQLSLF